MWCAAEQQSFLLPVAYSKGSPELQIWVSASGENLIRTSSLSLLILAGRGNSDPKGFMDYGLAAFRARGIGNRR